MAAAAEAAHICDHALAHDAPPVSGGGGVHDSPCAAAVGQLENPNRDLGHGLDAVEAGEIKADILLGAVRLLKG